MVKVYRLITCNTYEREMFDKASLKLGLDKAVLQSTTALKDTSVFYLFFPYNCLFLFHFLKYIFKIFFNYRLLFLATAFKKGN